MKMQKMIDLLGAKISVKEYEKLLLVYKYHPLFDLLFVNTNSDKMLKILYLECGIEIFDSFIKTAQLIKNNQEEMDKLNANQEQLQIEKNKLLDKF